MGCLEDTAPHALVLMVERNTLLSVDDRDRLSERPQHPDRHGTVVLMGTEHRMRVTMLARDDLVQNLRVQWQGSAHDLLTSGGGDSGAASRAIADSGIEIQPGRFRVSYTAS